MDEPALPLLEKRRRGIQPGQVARAGAPSDHEGLVASACAQAWSQAQPRLLASLPPGWSVVCYKGFRSHEVLDHLSRRGFELPESGMDMAGYYPDGGIYCLMTQAGRLLPYLAVEAKHQGAQGNAIERWHKNYTITKLLAWDMMMLTFATGEGAAPGGPIEGNRTFPTPSAGVDRSARVGPVQGLSAAGPVRKASDGKKVLVSPFFGRSGLKEAGGWVSLRTCPRMPSLSTLLPPPPRACPVG